MAVSPDVNFEELARSTDEFNGAQLKAVCVEAGMIALREGATKLNHEHFLSGIAEGAYICLDFDVDANHYLHSSKQEEERPYVFRLDWCDPHCILRVSIPYTCDLLLLDGEHWPWLLRCGHCWV